MAFTAEINIQTNGENAVGRAWEVGEQKLANYNTRLNVLDAINQSVGQHGIAAFGGQEKAAAAFEKQLDRLATAEGRRSANAAYNADRERKEIQAVRQGRLDQVPHSLRFREIQASERQANERRAMFGGRRDISTSDIAALSHGDPERRLTTGSVYRYQREPRVRSNVLGGLGRGGMNLMGNLGVPMGGAAIGYLGYEIQRSNREFIQKSDEAAQAFDGLARRLNVQAGLQGGDSAINRISDIAQARSRDKESAFNVSTQMVSSGFTAKEATGGALNEMLKLFNSMPAPGGVAVNETQLAEAFTSYLTSQNMEKTEGNVRKVGAAVQQFFKETNLQIADFAELAGQADTMRGKLSVSEQLAAFSVLRDVGKSAEEATTGLRQTVIQASTAGGNAQATEWLAKGGLKPADVDFHGEDLNTVLERLAGAKGKMDPAGFDIMLSKTFGDRQVATVTRLMEDRAKIADRAGRMGDEKAFEEDVSTMESGPEAAKRRQKLQQERWQKDHAQFDDLLNEELAQQARERGEGSLRVEARKKQYHVYRGLPFISRDTAAAAAYGDYLGIGGIDRVAEAKKSLGAKGINVDPSGLKVGSDWRDRQEEVARRNQGLPTAAEVEATIQPNYRNLPRPGAKTSAPAGMPDAAPQQPLALNAPRLERSGEQTVAVLEQIRDGINALRTDRPPANNQPGWRPGLDLPPQMPRSALNSKEVVG